MSIAKLLIIVSYFSPCFSEVILHSPKVSSLSADIEFYPDELKGVLVDENRDVSFGIIWENGAKYVDVQISVVSENPDILKIENATLMDERIREGLKNYTFTVRGVFLGYTSVTVKIADEHQSKEWHLKVSVVRQYNILVDIVTGLMAALVAFNYINMGVQLDMNVIGKVLKRPYGPTIGFFCQFLFMPLASYGISLLLLEDKSLQLGLFTLGCSPGGSMSNFWTLLFDGDVNLSVTMTFISTIAALAMMPLWIFTLGASLFRDRQATIPFVNLAGSLIILTLPIGIGLLIQQYSPRLSKISDRIIKPVTIVCVLFGISVGLYANSFVFYLFTWQVMLAGLSIAWGGYCFGAVVAWLFKLDKAQIIAVSIETAFQNPAVAFVMLVLSLPQPEADLSSVPVIAQLMLTGLPMWALLVATRIYRKFCKRTEKTDKKVYTVVEMNGAEDQCNM
ncbi:P3 protein [Parasteatoda tepidariorum]|nr:P3 protein [Parasteatoda tepidariorum]